MHPGIPPATAAPIASGPDIDTPIADRTKHPMKRFYRTVSVIDTDTGFGITLDTRPVHTPERQPLDVPTRTLADAIAEEWAGQGPTIDPSGMPLTQLSNVVIDRVAPDPAPIRAELVAYGGSDLLCYRADAPASLCRRESQAWDPLLDWAADTLGARLTVTSGVVHNAQPAEALAAFGRHIGALAPFELAGVRAAAGHLGSLVLALALHGGRIDAVAAHAAATVDEAFQAERWGPDGEAIRRQAAILAELEQIERFLRALGAGA